MMNAQSFKNSYFMPTVNMVKTFPEIVSEFL